MSPLFPWLTLVAIIWLQAMSGTNTDFPAYSSLLKSRLSITQVQLNNLAVASDTGKLFGWLSGLAATRLPLSSILAAGSLIGFLGYGLQFLFLSNKIPSLSYTQFFLLQVLAGNSICWVNTVCYVAAMTKFPADHGVVVGLATSYTGLSAKIYIAIAQVVLGTNFSYSDNNIYLLLNCFVLAGLAIVTAPFLAESKPARTGNGYGLSWVFVISCVTGGYAVAETLVPLLGAARASPVVLLVMVGSVAFVPPLLKAGEWVTERKRVPVRVAEEVGEVEVSVVEVAEEKEVERGGGEYGVWKLVRSVEFWMYFLVYLCGATLGLVFANNLGQIAESRGVQENVLLSISSSFGFFGKLSSACLSAFARSKYMVSRPAAVALLMVPMAASFFLLLSPTAACLFISTAVIGMCSGAITSIAVSMTSDLFGPEHFGVNHNIVVGNIPIGSFLFGYVAAILYDRANGGGYGACLGVHCYRITFIMWGCICSFGTLLSFALYLRTRNNSSSKV